MDFNFRNRQALTNDRLRGRQLTREEEEALKEQKHRQALALLEVARQQQSSPPGAGEVVSALGRSFGEQQIEDPGAAIANAAGLGAGKISNAGFASLQRNAPAQGLTQQGIGGGQTVPTVSASASSSGAEPGDQSQTFASPGATKRDYLGAGHAKMNQRNLVNVPEGEGYLELEITVSPLGKNLGFGQIIPGVGKRIAKGSRPGVQIEVMERGGSTIYDEVVQADPGDVVTKKYEIHPRRSYIVEISPIGSAVWDYTVYANNFFSDMLEE